VASSGSLKILAFVAWKCDRRAWLQKHAPVAEFKKNWMILEFSRAVFMAGGPSARHALANTIGRITKPDGGLTKYLD
jgi:hypothetical protein